jgi:hypothetical protein
MCAPQSSAAPLCGPHRAHALEEQSSKEWQAKTCTQDGLWDAPAQAERDVGGHGRHHDLVVRVLEHKAGGRVRAHGARVGLELPAQHAQQRGLAAAVGAEQDVQRAAPYRQARAAEHLRRSSWTLAHICSGAGCSAGWAATLYT